MFGAHFLQLLPMRLHFVTTVAVKILIVSIANVAEHLLCSRKSYACAVSLRVLDLPSNILASLEGNCQFQ